MPTGSLTPAAAKASSGQTVTGAPGCLSGSPVRRRTGSLPGACLRSPECLASSWSGGHKYEPSPYRRWPPLPSLHIGGPAAFRDESATDLPAVPCRGACTRQAAATLRAAHARSGSPRPPVSTREPAHQAPSQQSHRRVSCRVVSGGAVFAGDSAASWSRRDAIRDADGTVQRVSLGRLIDRDDVAAREVADAGPDCLPAATATRTSRDQEGMHDRCEGEQTSG